MHEGKHGIIDQWDDQTALFADGEGGSTSKKKGCIVLKKNNYLKVTYSHRNSELEGLGEKLVEWLREAGAPAVSEYFDRVQVIREEDPMTPQQAESYRKYVPEKLWKPDMTWSEALAWTKNAVAPLRDGSPWMVDYSGFNGAWVNRFMRLGNRNQIAIEKINDALTWRSFEPAALAASRSSPQRVPPL